MLRIQFRFFCVLLAVGFACHANAQGNNASFETRTGFPLPQPGAYYDPAQSGTGLFFDVGLDGTVFAAFMVYDPDGRPTFYTLQGPLERDSLPADQQDAIGIVRSPLYLTTGGSCLLCPAGNLATRAATEFGPAQMLFLEGRRLELRIGNARWRMERMAIDQSPVDHALGKFLLMVDETSASGARTQLVADVEFLGVEAAQGLPQVVSIEDPAPACGTVVPEHGVQRQLVCRGNCANFNAWAGGEYVRLLLWRNSDSTTYQLARTFRTATPSGVATLPGFSQYTLHLDALTVSATPAPRGCGAPAGTPAPLRLFRDPAWLYYVRMGQVWTRDPFTARPGFFIGPQASGTGIFVDRSEPRPDGHLSNGFVVLFDYDSDGRPSFRTMQGELRPTIRFVPDFGGMRAVLHESRGGQCIGCPWRPPATQDASLERQSLAFGEPLLVWHGGGSLLYSSAPFLHRAEGALTMRRMELDRLASDRVLGRWLLKVDSGAARPFPISGSYSDPSELLATVQITGLTGEAASSALFEGSLVYKLSCLHGCAGFDAWRRSSPVRGEVPPQDVLLWIPRSPIGDDLSSTDAVISLLTPTATGYVAGPGSRRYRMDIVPADRYRSYRCDLLLNPNQTCNSSSLQLFRNPPDAISN